MKAVKSPAVAYMEALRAYLRAALFARGSCALVGSRNATDGSAVPMNPMDLRSIGISRFRTITGRRAA